MGYIFALGFLAQIFFSARIIVQWFLSEKEGKVVSPVLFWVFSIAGSYIFMIYGWLRSDFSIILGQFISYYVYLWNLKAKGAWPKIPWPVKVLLMMTPVVAAVFLLNDSAQFVESFFKDKDIPLWLVIYGSTGQIVFTLRFVYQMIYSSVHKESLLPAGFWILSLAGSALIISYGIIRKDPVLILGQAVGFCAYSRNLMIGHKAVRKARSVSDTPTSSPE